MTKQEELTKCKCGGQFEYDGYNSIEIEEDYFVIKGDCRCNECGKDATYTECHKLEWNNPFDVEIEELEE